MLPAKYQPNRSGGSGGDVVSVIFTIYRHGGHLEFRIKTILVVFRSPKTVEVTYEIWLQLAQWLQTRSRLNLWTDDGRTTEASHRISSTGVFGSGELKIIQVPKTKCTGSTFSVYSGYILWKIHV